MSSRISTPKAALAALLVAFTPCLVHGQGAPNPNSPPRPEEVRQLIATLQAPEAAQHAKAVACHRLAVIGTPEAVPALAALLTDEKLSHMARHALEPLAAPAAGVALREALGKVRGPLLVGVINSLGVRRDALALPALTPLLSDADEAVVAATAAALGRIGSPEAAERLQAAMKKAPVSLQPALADARLACAEAMISGGKAKQAIAIYDSLCSSEFPPHIRTAAMYGSIMVRQADGLPLLLNQLKGQEAAMLAPVQRAARELPGPKVTEALAAEFARLPVEKQLLLLPIFGDRGDARALPVVLKAAQQDDAGVRLAALRVLPRIDDGRSSLPILLRSVMAARTPAESAAALSSLEQIADTNANSQILAALPKATPGLRIQLIGVLGVRGAENAAGAFLQYAASSDVETSKAAFRGLSLVGRPSDLPELIRLAATAQDEAVKMVANRSVYFVAMKITPPAQRVEPLLNAYRNATDAGIKGSILRMLITLVKAEGGSPRAFETVKAALNDADPQVRELALSYLAAWPDASPAALLLEIAIRDPQQHERALRGGVRMVSNVAAGGDRTPLDALAWFTQANQTVRTVEDKRLIVSGLGSLKQIEGLRLLQPYLSDPDVQREAELAVVALAPALSKSKDAVEVREALVKIAAATKTPDVRRKANAIIKGIKAR